MQVNNIKLTEKIYYKFKSSKLVVNWYRKLLHKLINKDFYI